MARPDAEARWASKPRSLSVASASTATNGGSGAAPRAPLMSIDDVAAYLGLSPRWVYAQVRSGRLPAILIARSWRIRPEAVDEFLASFELELGADC